VVDPKSYCFDERKPGENNCGWKTPQALLSSLKLYSLIYIKYIKRINNHY